MFRVIAATAAFAAVHSLFASRRVKDAAARRWGRRHRNGLYRPFYLAQTGVTLGALWAYIRPLPDRQLYQVRWPLAGLMHAGQGVGLLYTLLAAYQVGLPGFLGITSLLAWARGEEEVPPEPEAQGPTLDSEGQVRAAGPFAWSRHPTNLGPVVILWLSPRMTVKLAAFNAVLSVYSVLGSLHEEALLSDAYGEAYEAYRQSGCPFYIPRPQRMRRE